MDELQQYAEERAKKLSNEIDRWTPIDDETKYHIEQRFLYKAKKLTYFFEIDLLYRKLRGELLELHLG